MKVKRSFLLLILLVPLTVFGANDKTYQLTQGYSSDSWWDSGTYYQRYLNVSERSDGTWYLQFYTYCRYGSCPNNNGAYLQRCYTPDLSADNFQVANKNQIIGQVQEDDCDPYYLVGAWGSADFMFSADGEWENSSRYNNSHMRWEGPEGQQCFSSSNGGGYESRSANFEASIGAIDYSSENAQISHRITSNYVQNCSN